MAKLALIASQATHASAGNTELALEASGHTVTFVDDGDIGTHDFSSYDAIVLLRLSENQGQADALRAMIDAGKPALVGTLTQGQVAGTGQTPFPGLMHFMGTVEVVASTAGADGIDVTDNSHAVMAGFSLGELVTHDGDNFWAVLEAGQPHIGDALADGDPDVAGIAGLVETFAIEAGTPDLQDPPVNVGARVVVLGSLYGGQTGYAAAGEALLDQAVEWAIASATPDPPDTPTLTVDDVGIDEAELSGDAFSHPGAGTHAASQWQVAAAGTGFAAPVVDSGEDAVNLLSYTAEGLTAETEYEARVRYRDDAGEWSEWSAAVGFETDPAGGFRSIDFTFDQNGAAVVCAEREDGHLWIRFFDIAVPGTVLRDFGEGRDPVIMLDAPTDTAASDIVCFYIRDGLVRYRIQSEKYATEHDTAIAADADLHLERLIRTSDYRVHLIVSERDVGTGTWSLRRHSSELYPIPTDPAEMNVQLGSPSGVLVEILLAADGDPEAFDLGFGSPAGIIESTIVDYLGDPEEMDLGLSSPAGELLDVSVEAEAGPEEMDVGLGSPSGDLIVAVVDVEATVEEFDLAFGSPSGTLETV